MECKSGIWKHEPKEKEKNNNGIMNMVVPQTASWRVSLIPTRLVQRSPSDGMTLAHDRGHVR